MEPYFTTPLIIAEIVFSIMVLIALKNANTKNSVNKTLMFTIGTFLGLWLVSDYLMISNGFFSATGIPQISFAVALAIPVVIGVLAQKFWKPFASTICRQAVFLPYNKCVQYLAYYSFSLQHCQSGFRLLVGSVTYQRV